MDHHARKAGGCEQWAKSGIFPTCEAHATVNVHEDSTQGISEVPVHRDREAADPLGSMHGAFSIVHPCTVTTRSTGFDRSTTEGGV